MVTQISVPSNFRDRWFSKRFGIDVQERIRHAGQSIEIDFSNCEWVDPIPMMALICHLRAWANAIDPAKGHQLVVYLGRFSTRKEDLSKIRARLFLSAHGFLRTMIEICPSAIFHYDSSLEQYPSSFDASKLAQLEDAISISSATVDCALLYEKEPVCPPMLLTSGQETSVIASFVDKAVKVMDSRLFSGRQSQFLYRDSALVRVRQVATEIILNASEHAYHQLVSGPICLYARVRRHNDHSPDADAENTEQSPLIDHIQSITSGRYVELFICDIGHGLCHHANDWAESASDEELRTQVKRFLRKQKDRVQLLLSMAFRHPVSRHPRGQFAGTQTRSNVTGLFHVNTVLSSQKDRSRVFVSPTWTASHHPRPEDYNGGPSDRHFTAVEPEGTPPAGTFFHFAIAISNSELSTDGWLVPLMPGVFGPPWYRPQDAFLDGAYGNSNSLTVFDLASLLAKRSDPRGKVVRSVGEKFDAYLRGARSVAVIRMSRDFRKNLTDELVTRWLEQRSGGQSAKTLAFCDLSRAQAILLAEHLGNLRPETEFRSKEADELGPPGILVLSEDLIARMCYLNQEENSRLRFDKQVEPAPSLVLRVIGTLRHFDSQAFWRRVSGLKVPLLLRDVRWSGDGGTSANLRLPTYLDYPLAVQNRELAKIVRRALRRVLAAFPCRQAHAIDDLISPDLADASRWMARPANADKPPNLFVISSVVTGSTVEREARYRGTPEAVVACFLVESAPQQSRGAGGFFYYSALEWNPPLSSSSSRIELQWEREPGTPFVRPFVMRNDGAQTHALLIKPLARNIDDRGDDDHKRPSAAESYHEWHRDQLLKVGHWSIDRRHGLVEINHLGALQMFADSAKGFYEWLSHELKQRSSGIIRPLLVYPPGRLNAVMVRHLFKLYDQDGALRLGDNWQVVPINFLPDIGDGLKRLTPLTAEHISTCDGAIGGTAFFLDIGYVGNRTFRHTRRQLLALGIEHVIGFGLLNRTSSPALAKETKTSEVHCYWRMDVPSLDDERSCPICGALKAMTALLERTRRYQSESSVYVEHVFSNWQLSDPGQTWEDRGITPIELRIPLFKKFGFLPPKAPAPTIAPVEPQGGQQSLITPDGKSVPAPAAPITWWSSDSVDWKHVWLRDSAQAVTYAIEIARTQAAPLYPLRLARQLAEPSSATSTDYNGISAAVEVVSCYLLLCSHELSLATKEAGGGQLLRYLARMEGAPVSADEVVLKTRFARQRELAALALVNLDGVTKRLLLDEVVSVLTTTRMVNPETRVAIMATVLNPEEDGASSNDGISRFDKMVISRLQEREFRDSNEANTLRWNYRLLTLSEQTLPEQFDSAVTFFGAGSSHGDCVKRLKEAENDSNHFAGWGLCRSALQSAHMLICRNSRFGKENAVSDAEPGELFRALCNLDRTCIDQILTLSRVETVERYQRRVKEATQLIEMARSAFQNAMIRFDPGSSEHSLTLLLDRVTRLVASATVGPAMNSYRIHSAIKDFSQADGARYLLIGDELQRLIERLTKEALEYSAIESVSPPEGFRGVDSALRARLWILFSAEATGNVSVEFWNHGKHACVRPRDFELHAEDMAPVHKALRTTICRTAPEVGHTHWYVTKIEFRWISGGKT